MVLYDDDDDDDDDDDNDDMRELSRTSLDNRLVWRLNR